MSKFPSKFNSIETNAGPGICPSEGDGASIDARITSDATDIAILLAGGTLSDCPTDLADCGDDLTACGVDLGNCGSNLGDCQQLIGVQKTDQTVCYGPGGAVIACAGSGQDGEIQAGVARSYTDNGDGTITDDVTGLMWEKLSDDGSIHDKDDTYIWSNAFALKIDTLNTGSFAGYNDWRVPNIDELQSLNVYGQFSPSVDPAFNDNCIPACDELSCNCTVAAAYWSSTTYLGATASAWANYFTGGLIDDVTKGTSIRVRAVRGGSFPVCGNAIAEGLEDCDDTDLDGASCLTLGYNLGGTLSCSGGCTYDTTGCAFQPALPATGQTTSYGADDDGDLQVGATLTHVDNGDGTITDTTTGLIWEKKIALNNSGVNCVNETGSCANPHDADNRYSWGAASAPPYDGRVVTIFLEQLNNRCDQDTTVSCTVDADCAVPGGACGFAGEQDWRLPNLKELQSIVDYEAVNPFVSVSVAFNGANCGALCMDLSDPACSCTDTSSRYWSSTTYASNPTRAWHVYFSTGYVDDIGKEVGASVRAVRGGS
jgi:hypothetical protein